MMLGTTIMYLHSKFDQLHQFLQLGAIVNLEAGFLQVKPAFRDVGQCSVD